jgi:hypothetical protein
MATADIIELVRFFATDLAAVTDETVTTAIGLAQDEIDAARWSAAEVTDDVTADAYYDRASALLACHILTLRARQGATASAVQSESVGDASVSYAVAQSMAALDATGYGQQYAAFRSSIFAGAEMIAPAADDDEDA